MTITRAVSGFVGEASQFASTVRRPLLFASGVIVGSGTPSTLGYAGFTSAQNPHGGQESTLLALYNSIHHFGGILATPGYTDPAVFASGGNPYGVSVTAGGGGPTEADLNHARVLGKRVATIASRLGTRPAQAS